MQEYFHRYVPYSKGHKGKKKQMGPHRIKKKTALKGKENQLYGKTFANDTLDKGLISKIYKGLT